MSTSEPSADVQQRGLDARAQFELEKIAFARSALAEAQRFMVLDNAIILSLAQISAALAKYAEIHPERVFSDARPAGLGADLKVGDLAGGDFGSDLLGLIRDILLGDKEFILNLVKEILGM